MDKVIAIISYNHDTENHKKVLNLIYEHICQKQSYPVERIISNVVDDIILLPNRQTVLTCMFSGIKKSLKIDFRPEIPTLSDTSLRVMFKLLKIDTVVDIFKNILYERGLYLIGKSRCAGFHIIESLTTLLYPL